MKRKLWMLLLACLPGTAGARLPEGACFVMRQGADERAQARIGGVQALAIEFRPLTATDRAGKGYWRHLRIAARGQGLRDGVAGALMSATADCRTETLTCFSDGDASQLMFEVANADTILVRTSGFTIAEYGNGTGLSDLAERPGHETRYLLTRTNARPCLPD